MKSTSKTIRINFEATYTLAKGESIKDITKALEHACNTVVGDGFLTAHHNLDSQVDSYSATVQIGNKDTKPVSYWDAGVYNSGMGDVKPHTHEMRIADCRKTGSAYIEIDPIGGSNLDDNLTVVAEVSRLGEISADLPSLQLYIGEFNMARIYQLKDKLVIAPGDDTVSMKNERMITGIVRDGKQVYESVTVIE